MPPQVMVIRPNQKLDPESQKHMAQPFPERIHDFFHLLTLEQQNPCQKRNFVESLDFHMPPLI